MITRALISVSDKQNIVDFASQLTQMGVEILSTGGTAALLAKHHMTVLPVSDYTQFPEIMDGRVKTLHPKIYGGILGRRDIDAPVMQQHDIKTIDLVVVNLYPFEQVIQVTDCCFDDAIENIDIGGPAMIRAAAKNHAAVTVVVDPQDYEQVLAQMREHNRSVLPELRYEFARKAFQHTAHYDHVIANYLAPPISEDAQDNTRDAASQLTEFSSVITAQFNKVQDLRYGENPHQRAALYRDGLQQSGIATASQTQGKPLSFNNIVDVDTAFACVKVFDEPACVIVKHANPCGVATGHSLLAAYESAYVTDPTSAFGGIIAFNRELDNETATEILARQFVEVIIAPSVAPLAAQSLMAKPNLRVLAVGEPMLQYQSTLDYKWISGGVLVQEADNRNVMPSDWRIVSHKVPDESMQLDLLFAWRVAKFVKSNAIVYALNQRTVGIGAGQMSRVYSAKIAGIKAQDESLSIDGAAMASDAFFPFRDGIDAAAAVGIRAVIQPGGSKRDQEVIDAANEHDMAMVFTGVRHFRH